MFIQRIFQELDIKTVLMNGSTKVSDLKSRVLVSIFKDNLALSLGIQPISFYKRKSNFRSFFPDSLANSGIIREDKGMQNHLADSIISVAIPI